MPISPTTTNVDRNPHRAAFVATSIAATFAERAWSTRTLETSRCFRAYFIRRGEGAWRGPNGASIEAKGPVILWLPFVAAGEFRLAAGGEGAALLASEDFVSRTVGDNALAAQLRPLIERTLVAPLPTGGVLAEIDILFGSLAQEARLPGPGAPVISALYLGLVLMHLWRACGPGQESEAAGLGAPTAQRFRQLVELHYRDNLGIEDYARMLGVTRSHLHSACRRAFSQTPQRLVHERLVLEAGLRLRQTGQPVGQVAYSLGFRDPAYFNRFFHRLSGVSPGAYRKAARVEEPPRQTTAFEAWP
jgi:AraC family transcriptional activator of pobA